MSHGRSRLLGKSNDTNILASLVLVFLCLVANAQYPQPNPFGKIEVPSKSNDVVSILKFWKQLNSVKDEDLLKFDSILFYRNDTLKYTYYIPELTFFIENMTRSDSVIRAATDSLYNKELNSYDTYFTDINKNRVLDKRKYLNNEQRYYKAEQFNDGDVDVITNWSFDKQSKIVEETNTFTQDSSAYQMFYKRKESVILQANAKIKRRRSESEYTIDYNKKGGITGYSYRYKTAAEKDNQSFKVKRDDTNLSTVVKGFSNKKSFSFHFSYSKNSIEIDRRNSDGKTSFRLVMF